MDERKTHTVELGDIIDVCGSRFIAVEVQMFSGAPSRLILQTPIEFLEKN